MKKISIVTLTLGLMMLGACTVPKVDPDPLAAGPSAAQTREAIIRGMGQRSWNVKSETANEIIAQNNVRGKHLVVVSIKYDDNSVRIRYRDSQNLRYTKTSSGRELIHKNYNSWVENLRQDIARELTLLKAVH